MNHCETNVGFWYSELCIWTSVGMLSGCCLHALLLSHLKEVSRKENDSLMLFYEVSCTTT